MAKGDQIGTIKCQACGFESAKVTESKTGGASISCGVCGFTGWAKSPKASTGLRAQISGHAPPESKPAPAKPGKSFLDL